ncbi:MAG: CDP-diacylglycerol diphosphatase [Pseudomonadota bacterium]
MRRHRLAAAALFVLVPIALLFSPAPAKEPSDPTLLWSVISNLCLPNYTRTGLAFPCTEVDPRKGIAIVKAPGDKAHFLLVPTTPISGIESPALLAADAPDYWDDAWAFRGSLEKYAGRPIAWNDLGIAVNSARGRSQDQLHLHIACVRTMVKDALAKRQAVIGTKWTKLGFAVNGHRYLAMRVEQESFGDRDPFKLLAAGIPSARNAMAEYTLAVIGATFADGRRGFYVLTDRANPARKNNASGEELLDPECARPE